MSVVSLTDDCARGRARGATALHWQGIGGRAEGNQIVRRRDTNSAFYEWWWPGDSKFSSAKNQEAKSNRQVCDDRCRVVGTRCRGLVWVAVSETAPAISE